MFIIPHSVVFFLHFTSQFGSSTVFVHLYFIPQMPSWLWLIESFASNVSWENGKYFLLFVLFSVTVRHTALINHCESNSVKDQSINRCHLLSLTASHVYWSTQLLGDSVSSSLMHLTQSVSNTKLFFPLSISFNISGAVSTAKLYRCFLLLLVFRFLLSDRQLSAQRKDAALCVRLLDQYGTILVWAACLGTWTDEDEWCEGQHF